MKPTDAQGLFEGLLTAESTKEVGELLQSDYVRGLDWKPYGGYYKNYNIAGAQQKTPEGALAEKVVNRIDAQIMSGLLRLGIDPTSKEDDPSSPAEAAKLCFGFDHEALREMPPAERRKAIPLTVVLASGSKTTPCITVADDGEGQLASMIPDTFVSLHEGTSPKEDIPSVQGCFQMGGTGALRFCGTEGYQLVVTRRDPRLVREGQNNPWGFTLVRRHRANSKHAYSHYEYLVAGDGSVLTVDPTPLRLTPEGMEGLPLLEHGSIVKMYDYGLGHPYNIGLELRRDISRSLFEPALPFILYETRDYPDIRRGGRSRRVVGNSLEADPGVIEADLGVLGKRLIRFWAFKQRADNEDSEEKESKKDKKESRGLHARDFITSEAAVFFTINGQTHALLSRDFIRSPNWAGLYHLAPSLMIEVDCSDVIGDIRQDIFMSSRDDWVNDQTTRAIKKDLAQTLRDNPTLRQLDRERLEKKATSNPKDMATVAKIMKKLFVRDEKMKQMLQNLPGINFAMKVVKIGVPARKPKFQPKYPPTFLRINSWDPAKGEYVKHVPLGSFAKVTLETDAPNNYLTRSRGRGEISYDPAEMVKVRQSLKDGEMPVKLVPLPSMKVGDRQTVTFTLSMPRGEGDALEASVVIEVAPAQLPKPKPPPPPPKDRNKKTEEPEDYLPKLILVYEKPRDGEEDHSTWADMDPVWTGADVAIVEPDEPLKDTEGNEQSGMVVYINMDADCYRDFIRGAKSDSEIEYIKNLFVSSVYLHAIAHYQAMENGERETLLPKLMRTIGFFVLHLGYNQEVFKE